MRVQRCESSGSEKYAEAEDLLKKRQAEITLGVAAPTSLKKVKFTNLVGQRLECYLASQAERGKDKPMNK